MILSSRIGDVYDGGPDIITARELDAQGITVEDVRRRCPWATEYVGLDRLPCWRRDEVAELGDQP